MKHSVLLQLKQTLDAWLASWADRQSAKSKSGIAGKTKMAIDALKTEVEAEEPKAEEEDRYVRDLEHGRFEYASSESESEIRAADELMEGKADDAHKAYGRGSEALKTIQEKGLSQAETLAIKVYSVGDYQSINPTLQGSDPWLTSNLPKIPSKLNDAQGDVLKPGPEPDKAKNPIMWQQWDANQQRWTSLFNAWLAKAKANLAQVKKDAQRHAKHAESGLEKLDAYSGITWRGDSVDPARWPQYSKTGNQVTHSYFWSTSKLESRAKNFAKQNNPGDTAVLFKCTLTKKKGRDIQAISGHGDEQEVTMLPNAKFVVGPITPAGGPNNPSYELVELTEV